jgi:hypothetical protein
MRFPFPMIIIDYEGMNNCCRFHIFVDDKNVIFYRLFLMVRMVLIKYIGGTLDIGKRVQYGKKDGKR